MKRCPRCSIKYSDMWNICMVCGSPLAGDTVIPKVFLKDRQSSGYLFPIIEKSIEEADVMFLYLDADLNVVMCNKAAESITGYSRRDIFKGDWLGLLFGKNRSKRDIFKAVLVSSLSGFKSRVYKGSITKKDGTRCILSWSSTVVRDVSGRAKGLFCLARDITDYETENDDALACAERFRDIFSSIKDYAFITTNLANKITYYGPGAISIFEWDKEMVFKDISLLFPSDTGSNFVSRIKRKITGSRGFEEEVKLSRSGGHEFPAMLAVNALVNSEGKETGYIYIVRDITDRKKIEAQMIHSEKMVAMGQLAAGVAHEMNNPLLVILGRIDMLDMDNEEMSVPVKKTMDIISAQAKRMRTIVERLLSYSRKKPVSTSMINVNEILRTIAPLVAYYPEFHKIEWKENLRKDINKIKGDFNQLQEVFLNLAINACQAMPRGGTLNISSSETDNGFVLVTIEDTGSGIKKEDAGKLFLPFFTTKDNGTGLGLSLCYSIIESHGGSMEVESELDKGTSFTVKLPVYKKADLQAH